MSTDTTINEVPLLDLNAQYEGIRSEVKEAIDKVLESQYFILGPEVESFENQVADYCNAEHAVGCASGSDALMLSLMALDVGPGDAVITTPYTFFATAGAVARLGATPIFIDIDPVTYNIDPNLLEDFLKGEHPLNSKIDLDEYNLKAVIPVHLYGQMADMDPINSLADEHGFKVIEDAAQAIGSEYKGKRAGSVGDFGCFSFFPSKNLGGYGDGGLVTTNDAEMAEKLAVLRKHGANPKYHHKMVGVNSRLDALQAAVLKVKLQYLDGWSEDRREKALTYNRLFEKADLIADTESPGKIVLPREVEGDPGQGGRHIYHQFVIRTAQRQQVMDAFDKRNIGYSVYYPVPMHEQECFRYLGYESPDCPNASQASKTTLALPIYPEITIEQQEYVVDVIKNAISG